MPHRERIVYISQATFARTSRSGTVEPEIRRILMQSRPNSPLRGLVGVLYLSDGHFVPGTQGRTPSLSMRCCTRCMWMIVIAT